MEVVLQVKQARFCTQRSTWSDGLRRKDRPRRYRLEHGDIAVWGGPARLAFHGVAPLKDGDHPLIGRQRINLTFRKVL
jgi:alkylated DNA repair protein (DNA oxidative demethylase)